MSHERTPEQSGSGPAKPRDEAAIRRKIYAAVTEADDLLRDLLINGGCDGWREDIRRVRGSLAEWRVERS